MDIKLEFKEASGNMPSQNCHCCGKKMPVRYSAVLYPFRDADSEMLIFACGTQCREKLLAMSQDKITKALTAMAMDIANKMHLRLKKEWEECLP